MTIEQLICPAVITWERDYRKKLNENHIEMTDDEIADELINGSLKMKMLSINLFLITLSIFMRLCKGIIINSV